MQIGDDRRSAYERREEGGGWHRTARVARVGGPAAFRRRTKVKPHRRPLSCRKSTITSRQQRRAGAADSGRAKTAISTSRGSREAARRRSGSRLPAAGDGEITDDRRRYARFLFFTQSLNANCSALMIYTISLKPEASGPWHIPRLTYYTTINYGVTNHQNYLTLLYTPTFA